MFCIVEFSMSLPLLRTKLYIPPGRPNLVRRAHLLDRLRNRRARPLTLVCAPAGFGKTTLVSAWLNALRAERPDEPTLGTPPATSANPQVAWLALDDDDNDPLRFLTYLIAALQTCQAQMGETALALLAAPQPPP